MFTFFTDRDGKMQLEALAQSGFDPLSRTCRFMLTEEAHHMFVGETGDHAASIERTCQAMKATPASPTRTDTEAVREARRDRSADDPAQDANLHFSLTLDLFGNEISTNAANAFNSGLKGRYQRGQADRRPPALADLETYPVLRGKRRHAIVQEEQVPALSVVEHAAA